MTKFAMTYATVSGLINNAEVRAVSPAVKAAFDAANIEVQGEGCSACSKRKKMNDAATKLISQLQASSDMELDRIKKALGVEKLVFPNGLTFIER